MSAANCTFRVPFGMSTPAIFVEPTAEIATLPPLYSISPALAPAAAICGPH